MRRSRPRPILYLRGIGHVQTYGAGAAWILPLQVGNGFLFASRGDNAIAVANTASASLRPKPVDAPVMNQTRDVSVLIFGIPLHWGVW